MEKQITCSKEAKYLQVCVTRGLSISLVRMEPYIIIFGSLIQSVNEAQFSVAH
jgi:hypothetical protein